VGDLGGLGAVCRVCGDNLGHVGGSGAVLGVLDATVSSRDAGHCGNSEGGSETHDGISREVVGLLVRLSIKELYYRGVCVSCGSECVSECVVVDEGRKESSWKGVDGLGLLDSRRCCMRGRSRQARLTNHLTPALLVKRNRRLFMSVRWIGETGSEVCIYPSRPVL